MLYAPSEGGRQWLMVISVQRSRAQRGSEEWEDEIGDVQAHIMRV